MNVEKKPSPSAAPDKVMVRMHDEGLRKMLKIRAVNNERTLNAEIIYLVKKGLSAEACQEKTDADHQ